MVGCSNKYKGRRWCTEYRWWWGGWQYRIRWFRGLWYCGTGIFALNHISRYFIYLLTFNLIKHSCCKISVVIGVHMWIPWRKSRKPTFYVIPCIRPYWTKTRRANLASPDQFISRPPPPPTVCSPKAMVHANHGNKTI